MNKKVCLLSPPSRSINHFRPPVALLYLAGFCERNGIDIDIIDITLDDQIRNQEFYKNINKHLKVIEREIIDQVRQLNPDVVGITCYTPEYFEVLSLANEVKKINKDIRIVVGGIHPTFYPEDFFYKNSPFDIAVQGEGEITLFEVINKINNVSKWSSIKSIAFYDNKSKKIVITPKRPLHENLDELANPAYHKINMEYYTTANPYAIRGIFTRCAYILSSRGCPSQCTFCVAKKIREFSGSKLCTRLRSPKHLFEEIEYLKKKYKIDSFWFIDDLFTLNKNQVKEFCHLLVKSKLNLIYGCSSKVTTVDYETLKTMKKSGCVQIDFGVERGSNEALNFVKKGITIEIIKRVFADCNRLGIRTFANMLINLPRETEKDLDDILKLLDEIKATIVSINVFTPYPGTEIFENYKTGITKKDYPKLMTDATLLIKKEPNKYKFSDHQVDLSNWVVRNNKRYNRILPTIAFHLSPIYLSNLFNSKRKLNYLKMTGSLVKEFINQKF